MLDVKWELILYTFRDNLSKSCVIEPPSYIYVTEILFVVLYPLFNTKYGVLEHFPYKGVSRFLERGIFSFRWWDIHFSSLRKQAGLLEGGGNVSL